MKTLIRIIFLVLAIMLMALTIITNADLIATVPNQPTTSTEAESEKAASSNSLLRGTKSRFLASRRPLTCDKNPKVCYAKGSAGSDCCKKKCVDLSSDRVNCGRCGKKCKFSELCCKGRCVNPRSDKRNCGSCNNRCNKGSSCVYGMCSYA
ncbi:stigma-specific STIG1-like protein 1 [Cannabis sativa]|uniref:stigma-specific STIG1-like protein 1 n=1 Tax=Cannabis sativa TaxID=3483 RepID=UPI0029CA25A7|nr:stigma-specific STIG1-like protein 1 [Cannabis sativa]